jgi:hypothetical protein
MKRKRRSSTSPILLEKVVAEMDLPNDEWTAYLNRRTGELVTVTDEEARVVEDGEEMSDAPDWQKDNLPKVREVLASKDYLPLPGRFEIHEYQIMQRFCGEIEDPKLRVRLLDAISGRGAFRMFRSVLNEHDMAESWYKYRQRALEDIAAEWLDGHGIAYTRGQESRDENGA